VRSGALTVLAETVIYEDVLREQAGGISGGALPPRQPVDVRAAESDGAPCCNAGIKPA